MSAHAEPEPTDPYLWLEDVQGEQALAWVHAQNAHSRAQLQCHPRFAAMRSSFEAILDSADKIPQVSRRGDWFYNLWRDATPWPVAALHAGQFQHGRA